MSELLEPPVETVGDCGCPPPGPDTSPACRVLPPLPHPTGAFPTEVPAEDYEIVV